MNDLKVSNVVICVTLKNKLLCGEKEIKEAFNLKKDIYAKYFHNFAVVRDKHLRYVIFFQSGHVNIIGTKCFEHISESLDQFGRFIGEKCVQCRIVNSTWTTKIKNERNPSIIDLYKLREKCFGGKDDFRCSLRPSIFPAAVLRHHNLPTVILFKNGTANIVGAKCEVEAKEALTYVLSKVEFI